MRLKFCVQCKSYIITNICRITSKLLIHLPACVPSSRSIKGETCEGVGEGTSEGGGGGVSERGSKREAKDIGLPFLLTGQFICCCASPLF